MLRHEIGIMRKNKRAILIILFLLCLVLLDAVKVYQMNFIWFGYIWRSDYQNIANLMHPASGAFLSSVTEGHIYQMMYEWLLPVYLLLIYSDKTIEETRSGYFSLMMMKQGKQKFLKTKFLCAFIIGFMIVFVTLCINYFILIVILHGGQDFQGMLSGDFPTHFIFTFSMKYPYVTYFLYICTSSILAGGCAMICTSLSMIFTQYRYLYLAAFLVWYLQITAKNSLTYITQPFIEYDWQYVLPALGRFIIIWWIIVLAGYFYRMRKDET